MRRRQLLAGSLGVVSCGLAGCLTDVGSDGNASTPDETTTVRTTEPEPTTDEGGALEPATGPGVAETAFRGTGGGCGDGMDEASVAFDEDGVTVTGTISGRDDCARPRLASATYDADADELSVLVETYAEGDVCSQCLVDLGYEATVRLDSGGPGAVVVRHASRGEERTAARATA